MPGTFNPECASYSERENMKTRKRLRRTRANGYYLSTNTRRWEELERRIIRRQEAKHDLRMLAATLLMMTSAVTYSFTAYILMFW